MGRPAAAKHRLLAASAAPPHSSIRLLRRSPSASRLTGSWATTTRTVLSAYSTETVARGAEVCCSTQTGIATSSSTSKKESRKFRPVRVR